MAKNKHSSQINGTEEIKSTSELEVPESSVVPEDERFELEKMKSIIEAKKKKISAWEKNMPFHGKVDKYGEPVLDENGYPVPIPTPEFLTDPSKSGERVEIAGKLRVLLKRRFALSYIADAFLYNEYDIIDDIIYDRENFWDVAQKYYPSFTSDFKAKVGSDSSKAYSAEEKKIKALIDFLESGKFFESEDSHSFQDAVSSVVDTAKFNSACRIETEFLSNEYDVLITNLREKAELDLLISRAIELQNEINRKKYACKTIEDLMSGRKGPAKPTLGDR